MFFHLFVTSVLIPSALVFGIATLINHRRETQRKLFNEHVEREEEKLLNLVDKELRAFVEKEEQFERKTPRKES